MARAVLIGNLTKDPELRHTAGGTAVCSLSVAVNSREKGSDGQWGDYVSFFDVTVYGGQADACAQHLHKGSPVAVDARVKQERWEKDGTKRYAVKFIADNVQFLPSKRDGASGGGSSGGDFAVPSDEFQVPTADFAVAGSDDDIPF